MEQSKPALAKAKGKANGVRQLIIRHVAIFKLMPYARNALTHSKAQVRQVAGASENSAGPSRC